MDFLFKCGDVHSCEAVVLTCIDFRFWRPTLEYIEKELGFDSFDFPSLPGAAKAINDCHDQSGLARQCVTVPYDLHHAKTLIIVNHQDCGAYGGSKKFNGDDRAEQEFHQAELRKAKKTALADHPDLKVILVYAKLDQAREKVTFLTID